MNIDGRKAKNDEPGMVAFHSHDPPELNSNRRPALLEGAIAHPFHSEMGCTASKPPGSRRTVDDAATVSFAPFSKESMATINSKVKPGKQVSPPAWDVWQGCPALSAVLIRGFNVDSTNCFATRICTAADHAKQMKDELVPDLPRYPPPLLTLKSDTSPLQVLFMTYLPLSAPC